MFSRDHPDQPRSSNLPAGAFGIRSAAAGSAAIGIFFAFWSWVGFETTAVYGEESRNPKHIVPRATLIAVVALGLFYTFISWMVIVGHGPSGLWSSRSAPRPSTCWLTLVNSNLGGVAQAIYKFLLVIGSFACAMAFHNAASRYIYALGREIPSAQVRDTLGATHPMHHSPDFASWLQTAITPPHGAVLPLHRGLRCPTPTARQWTPRRWCPTSTSTACWR